MKKAIVYYTDNNLQYDLAKKCRNILMGNCLGIPIISVSQKPIVYPENFSHNICVGRIGRSHLNLYKQIVVGCKATDADIVFLAEHDVCYSPEHFNFEPPEKDVFYYNLNCWFVNWKVEDKNKGMYSSPWGIRHATSQLVCNRELLIDHISQRIAYLEEGWAIRKGQRGACEPGVQDDKAFIKRHDDGISLSLTWARKWKSSTFQTEISNIDIRNGQNLTGWRRGSNNTYNIPYWGKFKEVMR
jgi:hypothetical protein